MEFSVKIWLSMRLKITKSRVSLSLTRKRILEKTKRGGSGQIDSPVFLGLSMFEVNVFLDKTTF